MLVIQTKALGSNPETCLPRASLKRQEWLQEIAFWVGSDVHQARGKVSHVR